MKTRFSLASGFLFLASQVFANQFQQGDWASTKIGNTCFVHTLRSARDTSGTLIFSFLDGGYSASFSYEYTAWPGETEPPWGENDPVILAVDDQATWLAEEVFTGMSSSGYEAAMTAGFVSEMVKLISTAERNISVSFDRADHGEVWLYGLFGTVGFRESLTQAAEWCNFDPANLPQS